MLFHPRLRADVGTIFAVHCVVTHITLRQNASPAPTRHGAPKPGADLPLVRASVAVGVPVAEPREGNALWVGMVETGGRVFACKTHANFDLGNGVSAEVFDNEARILYQSTQVRLPMLAQLARVVMFFDYVYSYLAVCLSKSTSFLHFG